MLDKASSAPHSFPIWKTIRIGGKTKEELLAQLDTKGFKVTDGARSLMASASFTTLIEPHEVDLVCTDNSELGFTECPTFGQMRTRAKEMGLEMCPA